MIEQIQNAIQAAIPDAQIAVLDPNNDGHHFEAVVVSPAFEGMPLVRQHRLVLNALKEEFASDVVHALSLKTFTPAKWEQSKHFYQVKFQKAVTQRAAE